MLSDFIDINGEAPPTNWTIRSYNLHIKEATNVSARKCETIQFLQVKKQMMSISKALKLLVIFFAIDAFNDYKLISVSLDLTG